MRDYSAHERRQWRSMKRRFQFLFSKAKKAMILILVILLQCLMCLLCSRYNAGKVYGINGPLTDLNGNQLIFHGERAPVNPASLRGLTTTVNTYSAAELERRFRKMDFIYTFVNGSETNHAYRRELVLTCLKKLQDMEEDMYFGRPLRSRCTNPRITFSNMTNREVLGRVQGTIIPSRFSARDRERDELRYSIRSLEKHMRWHRGRLIIVSPGHHPNWIDAAKNFFSSACASDAAGQHRRIITVHQDAVMPYGMRLTINSHGVELHLFRLRHTTPIHVFFNDDYFIYRDVAVSDLLNKHGGTYVRTESHIVNRADLANNSTSWVDGVYNTNLINAVELDHNAEDFIPPALLQAWHTAGYTKGSTIPVASGDSLVHTARSTKLEPLPQRIHSERPRFFATHAPFVYCTRMFEFFSTRYAREIAHNGLAFRSRSAKDFFVPFLYNAFIMARPWQASPRFLPHVAALHASRRKENPEPAPKPININLDNIDGCGPATLLRSPASGAMYSIFKDDEVSNAANMRNLERNNPLFFNVNDNFKSLNATAQLQNFLRRLFPVPVFVERAKENTAVGIEDTDKEQQRQTLEHKAQSGKYSAAYDALMQLPLVILTSYSEAFCPVVRSVHLALQNFRGPIVLARAPLLNGPNPVDDNIAHLREKLRHRVRSAVPVTKCTFSSHVGIVKVTAGANLVDEVREAIMGSAKAKSAFDNAPAAARMPGDYEGPNEAIGKPVRAIVIDARAKHAIDSVAALTQALQAPAQTLALDDFEPLGLPGETGAAGIALVLALRDAERRGIHWVNGAAEEDLLLTFPLPSNVYEDPDARAKWSL